MNLIGHFGVLTASATERSFRIHLYLGKQIEAIASQTLQAFFVGLADVSRLGQMSVDDAVTAQSARPDPHSPKLRHINV
jgi:hypothetical protein